jgi:FecR-like protein
MTDELDDRLRELGAVARVRDGEVSVDTDAAGRDRLVHAVVSGARPRRQVRRFALLAAAAVVLAVVVVLAWPAGALRYEVRGAALAEGGYVRADDGASLAFSDGTEVTLEARSVARVVEVTSDGARLLLEDGRARLSVTPRSGARWSVSAGPFEVLVTGTRFDLEWSHSEQRLRLDLVEGTVHVRGPLLDGGIALAAGQRLVADHAGVHIGLLSDPIAALDIPSAAASDTPGAVPEAPVEAPSTAAPVAPAKSWSKRIAEGDIDGVLAEAEARGLEAVIAGGTLDELVALADAARYRGRASLARRALEAVRERHPTSGAAHTAAFLLGRLAEGGGGGALRWYDQYLAESPNGTFAAEAFGRKLVILRGSDPARARTLAAEYLKRWPNGAHAALARDLTR